MTPGNLYLIPTYLSDANDKSFMAPLVVDVIKNTTHFLVENIRTTRRFISSLKSGIDIDTLQFEILDKKTTWDDLYTLFEPVRGGQQMGLISEAGLPCLADPGHLAVSFAHQNKIQVVPLPGSSSIQMALIASGFNGQQFTFHGYIPIDKASRVKRIKELEAHATKGYTQLFMETPYRNHQLLEDILKACRPDTFLSIAAAISGTDEFICTQTIRKWKSEKIQIHKIPAIFSFGQLG